MQRITRHLDTTASKVKFWIIVVASLVAFCICVTGLVYVLAHQGVIACEASNHVDNVLRSLVRLQYHRAGQKGTATYDYYLHHPRLLAQTKANYQILLDKLVPKICG